MESYRINQADFLQSPGNKFQDLFSKPLFKWDMGEIVQCWYPHSSSTYLNRENIYPFCCRHPIGYAMFFQLLDWYLAVVSEQFQI